MPRLDDKWAWQACQHQRQQQQPTTSRPRPAHRRHKEELGQRHDGIPLQKAYQTTFVGVGGEGEGEGVGYFAILPVIRMDHRVVTGEQELPWVIAARRPIPSLSSTTRRRAPAGSKQPLGGIARETWKT